MVERTLRNLAYLNRNGVLVTKANWGRQEDVPYRTGFLVEGIYPVDDPSGTLPTPAKLTVENASG